MMKPPSPTAAELRRARSGDVDALKSLIASEAPALWPFCLRAARWHRADADDLLQEVFVRAIRGLGTYRSATPLRTWLFQIARNAAIDASRRRRPERLDVDSAVTLSPPPPSQTENHLQDGLARLDPLTRQLVELRYGHGVSRDDLAELTGLSLEAIKKRLLRALADLRISLKPTQEIPE